MSLAKRLTGLKRPLMTWKPWWKGKAFAPRRLDIDQCGQPGHRLRAMKMDPVLEKYAMADVPRYTSYPTAVQFTDGFDGDVWKGWLAALADAGSLSAYVHVPFCEKLCWYCGCHTSVPNSYDRAKSYTDTLVEEISSTGALTGGQKGRVDHFHFGGGTPTYLKAQDLERIVSAIDEAFGIAPGAEVAIETDPRTFSPDMARALKAMGFNRASFGVQDFNLEVQKKINRIQPYEQVAKCMEDMRSAGIDAINFDLIYGLPGQTIDSVIDTAHQAARLRPSRIAVFGYAHVPWFKKHMKMIRDEDLPGVEARYEQTLAMTRTLCEEGYIAIGLDHFVLPDDDMAAAAKNGTLRRNFQGYTTDASDA
ncbi:MAG TPA: oxygen-independent coproporphyrinogen III oxidase, partial [Rhizobiales bacterium]|nr:oxygen-independent coproporphyrinogen III oxidase [Hyphomicrobiales bacterium]